MVWLGLLGLIAHGARVQAHEGRGIDKLSLGAPGPDGTPPNLISLVLLVNLLVFLLILLVNLLIIIDWIACNLITVFLHSSMLLFKHACVFFSSFLLSRNYKTQIVAHVGRESAVVLSGIMEASYSHFFVGRVFILEYYSGSRRIEFSQVYSYENL